MSRQSFAVGDALGKNSPKYYLRQTVSGHSLASHESRIGQPIESVASYAGQTITVLGWARRSSGTGNMALECAQIFGTGGSPSANVTNIGVNSITLTGSWAPFAAVVPVPSISGKTLGSDGNDRLTITFWTSAGSNFNSRTNSLGIQTIGVDLWGVHIRHGTHTTDSVNAYVAPDLASEFVKCQRYYEKSYSITTNPGTATSINSVLHTVYASASYPSDTTHFNTWKRTNPTVTLYSTSGASATVRDNNAAADRAVLVSQNGQQCFVWYVNNISITPVNTLLFHWTADAEL
jgi:hypothetical protein